MQCGAASFNEDISGWDTPSQVTDMAFRYVQTSFAFNQPIGSWVVDKVEDMRWMFKNTGTSTASFNQDLSGGTFPTSRVCGTCSNTPRSSTRTSAGCVDRQRLPQGYWMTLWAIEDAIQHRDVYGTVLQRSRICEYDFGSHAHAVQNLGWSRFVPTWTFDADGDAFGSVPRPAPKRQAFDGIEGRQPALGARRRRLRRDRYT